MGRGSRTSGGRLDGGGVAARPGRGLAALACLAALAGCSIPDNFVDRAVNHNKSLEQAENETLLVNILRAANERPLYFANFSAISGSMSAAVGTGAEGSIGWESGNSTSLGAALTPSFTIENSPSFDLAVQDTQAFARGVLTPIDNNVLDVFYQQDRDMERLLDLFVSRIDLFVKPREGSRAEDDYLASFWNDPFFERRATDAQVTKGVKPQEYGRAGFRCVRTALADAGLDLRQAEPLEPTDLTLPVGQLGDAEAIASALKDGIRFVPGTSAGSVELFRIAGDREFAFAGTPKTQPSAAPASKSARTTGRTGRAWCSWSSRCSCAPPRESSVTSASAPARATAPRSARSVPSPPIRRPKGPT